jgi:hypothetical protein
VWNPAIEALTEGRRYFEELAEFAEEGHLEFSQVHDLGDQVLPWVTFG